MWLFLGVPALSRPVLRSRRRTAPAAIRQQYRLEQLQRKYKASGSGSEPPSKYVHTWTVCLNQVRGWKGSCKAGRSITKPCIHSWALQLEVSWDRCRLDTLEGSSGYEFEILLGSVFRGRSASKSEMQTLHSALSVPWWNSFLLSVLLLPKGLLLFLKASANLMTSNPQTCEWMLPWVRFPRARLF